MMELLKRFEEGSIGDDIKSLDGDEADSEEIDFAKRFKSVDLGA
jgi:hypothetical protein